MKKLIINLIVFIMVLPLISCKKETPEMKVNVNDPVFLEGIYLDPLIKAKLTIANPDFVFHKDVANTITYFYHKSDANGSNLISLSSQAVLDNDEAMMERQWKLVEPGFISFGFELQEREALLVAGKYPGFHYPFSLVEQEVYYDGDWTVWCAEGRMYILMLTVTADFQAEYRAVYDGILASFSPYFK